MRRKISYLEDSVYLMGEIEKCRTDFISTRKWLGDYPGTKYEIGEIGDYLWIVVVQTAIENLKEPNRLSEKLPDLQMAIVLQMRSNPKITYDQLAKATL